VASFTQTATSADVNNPFRRDSAVMGMTQAWGVMDLATHGSEFLRQFCRGSGSWGALGGIAASMVGLDPLLGPDFEDMYQLNLIPKEHKEPDDAWHARIDRSVLSPYTARLIDNAAALILRRAITVDGDPYWTEFCENVDGWGSSLNEYARRVLRQSLTYGHSGILVDYPPKAPVRNLMEERMLPDRRPYFISYSAKRIRGWRQADNYPTSPLVQLRLSETTTLPAGDFGEQVYERVRVLTPSSYSLYQRQASRGTSGDLVGTGENQLGVIPFVPIYSLRTGLLRSQPPMQDIAEINLAHFQRQADLLHSLHVAAMPKLVMEGWDDSTDGIGVGVNFALIPEPGHKIYYVQSDASSFAAQQEQLRMFEAQMSTLGVTRLLGQKMVAEAAEAKRVEQAQSNSVMASISLELEHGLNAAFAMAGAYVGIEPPKIALDRDFDFYRLIGQDISVLADATVQGLISPEMWLDIMRKGEIIPDTADVDTELEYIEEQMAQKEEQARAATVMAQRPPQSAAPRQPAVIGRNN
jgi:hypothetical protein